MSENSNKPMKAASGFKGGFFGCLGVGVAIIVLLVAILFVTQCTLSNVEKSAREAVHKDEADKIARGDNWTYASNKDPMTDAVTQTACTASANEVTQDLPFENSKADLCLRKGAVGTSVDITLQQVGRVECADKSCAIPVRFDAAEAQEFKATIRHVEHGADPIVFSDAAKFIDGLKRADRTLVQVDVPGHDKQIVTFNTKGLKWP